MMSLLNLRLSMERFVKRLSFEAQILIKERSVVNIGLLTSSPSASRYATILFGAAALLVQISCRSRASTCVVRTFTGKGSE